MTYTSFGIKANFNLSAKQNRHSHFHNDAFDNHANFPRHIRRNTAAGYEAIVDKRGKCENSKCALRRTLSQIIHAFSSQIIVAAMTLRAAIKQSPCAITSCGTAEGRLLGKKKSHDSHQAK